MTQRPSLWAQAKLIARRDVLRERRSGEVLWVTVPSGALAMLLIPLGIGIDTPTLRRIGPGLFWVVVLLFGVLVTIRRSNSETAPVRMLMARLGVDPVGELVGKAIASTAMLLLFELVVGAVAVVLYDIDLTRWPVLLVIVPTVAIGMGLLGTITGVIAGPAGATNLVPFLVAPLAVPLLLGATQAMNPITPNNGILGWLVLMLLVVVVLVLAGVLAARPLQEME